MKRILVVDDEFDIADAVRTILEDEGYEVEVTGSGKQALDALDRRKPDLLILDLMMPGLTGTDLLEIVRAKPSTSSLPVVLMSAVRPSAGAPPGSWQAFLPKPFTLDALLKTVEAQLGSSADGAS